MTFELNLKEGGEGAQQAGQAFHVEGTEQVPAGEKKGRRKEKITRSMCLEVASSLVYLDYKA